MVWTAIVVSSVDVVKNIKMDMVDDMADNMSDYLCRDGHLIVPCNCQHVALGALLIFLNSVSVLLRISH